MPSREAAKEEVCRQPSLPDARASGTFFCGLEAHPRVSGVRVAQLEFKARLLEPDDMRRAITRIAHEILERNKGAMNLAIVGIHTRGIPLAKRIAQRVSELEGIDIPSGKLDITLYRDDLSEVGLQPIVRQTEVPFDISSRRIVMVDDVFFTGRTARAGLDALIDLGRPGSIQLAVLIDRGHRELPIRADYVGKNIPTSKQEVVKVKLEETDGEDAVELYELRGEVKS
jgi:pyrimidine operon attenuation protein / uracil phosphoribosyltransferase